MTKPTDSRPSSIWAKVLALILLWIIALSPLYFLDDPAARRDAFDPWLRAVADLAGS